jgi:hypothetical protein
LPFLNLRKAETFVGGFAPFMDWAKQSFWIPRLWREGQFRRNEWEYPAITHVENNNPNWRPPCFYPHKTLSSQIIWFTYDIGDASEKIIWFTYGVGGASEKIIWFTYGVSGPSEKIIWFAYGVGAPSENENRLSPLFFSVDNLMGLATRFVTEPEFV